MRSNIKLGLFSLVPPALLALLSHVIDKLTGNALFPNPPEPLAGMTTLRDEFEQAISAATGGGVEDRKKRNNKVLEVQDVLRATADYVRAQCDGDAAKLASSGFELAKQREPINAVGVPKNLVAAKTSSPKEVLLRWGNTDGARMFRTEKADIDPTLGSATWTTVGQTSRQRLVVTGLVPYAPNWFRVIAIGKESEGMPSDVVLARAA